ncbi:MAG: 7-carboxy-7-deazaguanine synthase QueE [Thermoguttaceae bacterium]|nr:7-carboxy-7-deazaguanine synthase QueE [Thermoguttaceae bacterium]
MRIAEIFRSKQGEGFWTGTDSLFIRVSGCPLHCGFCDTAYASWKIDHAEELSCDQILTRVLAEGTEHVVITGGEPMVQAGIVELTHRLCEYNRVITIETAGIAAPPVKCDLMSISPKRGNSTPLGAPEEVIRRHEALRDQKQIVRRLIADYPYQLKFVVDHPDDLDDIDGYLTALGSVDSSRVCVMPMAVDTPSMAEKLVWIRPYCRSRGFYYTSRMQLVWFGNRRGT